VKQWSNPHLGCSNNWKQQLVTVKEKWKQQSILVQPTKIINLCQRQIKTTINLFNEVVPFGASHWTKRQTSGCRWQKHKSTINLCNWEIEMSCLLKKQEQWLTQMPTSQVAPCTQEQKKIKTSISYWVHSPGQLLPPHKTYGLVTEQPPEPTEMHTLVEQRGTTSYLH